MYNPLLEFRLLSQLNNPLPPPRSEYHHRNNEFDLLNKISLSPAYCAIQKSSAKDKFVYGRFEDVRYFDKIRNQLLDEIQPVEAELIENKLLYDVLKSDAETVCISIRRGDYISNAEVEKKLNICSKEYFEKAVNCIKEKVKNPVFVVFSDDVEWSAYFAPLIKTEQQTKKQRI